MGKRQTAVPVHRAHPNSRQSYAAACVICTVTRAESVVLADTYGPSQEASEMALLSSLSWC